MAVGGLPESIVDEQTGLLADTPRGAGREGRRARGRPRAPRRARRGRARPRPRLHVGHDGGVEPRGARARGRRPSARGCATRCARSETGAAAGPGRRRRWLNNAIQLVFVVLFTRLLGADGYGALAAIISGFLILMVGGQSMQVAAAREATLGRLGADGRLRATLATWTRQLVAGDASCWRVVGVAAARAARRRPRHARAPVGGGRRCCRPARCGCCCRLQRGVLQGLRAYGPVGAVDRRRGASGASSAALAALRASGSASPAPTSATRWPSCSCRCGWARGSRAMLGPAERPGPGPSRVRPIAGLVGDNWLPLLGLLLLAVLQNVDVIVGPPRVPRRPRRAPTRSRRSRPSRSCGWRSASGCSCCPRRRAARPPGLDPRPALLRALGGAGRGRGARADHLRARPRAAAARRLRARTSPRPSSALPVLGAGDDAAGRRVPDRPVHGGPGRAAVRLGARRRRDRRAVPAQRRAR